MYSDTAVPKQRRYLCGEGMLQQTEHRFGPIVGCYVLYCGPELPASEDSVRYRNVKAYLERPSRRIVFADVKPI